MIRGNVSPGAASSNRSSDEAASHHGSPETKLTAFSPEDVRMKSLLGNGSGIGTRQGEAADFNSAHGTGRGPNPFMTVPGSDAQAQLCATANTFAPADFIPGGFAGNDRISAFLKHDDASDANIGYLAATSDPETPIAPNGPFARNSPPRFGPIGPNSIMPFAYPKQNEEARSKLSYLTATSEPETPFTPNGTYAMNSPPRFGAIGPLNLVSAPSMMYCQIGVFDKVNRSRAFMIDGAPTDLAYLSIVNLFDRHEFSTLKGPILTELATHGRIYVAFTDCRDAKAAFDKIQKIYPTWFLQPLTAKEFASKLGNIHVAKTSNYEGHIAASVYFNGHHPGADGRVLSHNFKNILEKFGDIKAFSTIPTEQNHVIDFMVEFFDIRAAENVASTLNGSSVDGCILEIKLYKPDLAENHRFDIERKDICELTATQPHGRHGSIIGRPYVELSPTGRSTIPIGDPAGDYTWLRKADDGFSYRSRHELGRRHETRSNNQNYVDIEKIRLGLDVRTTIMLRNIPNKIDQAMLKDIVDETSFGKYDFMYLRIDFANNCNVGYAFINFEDPIDIIDFATARAGRTWNCFNSDKIAEISYATIQGRDCLVQKFRNSSVMLEHPSFRPKLFYTGTGPLAGAEECFPGPDNPSKMRRSVENAEHVGLFAPRVGQQYRDEQRRRRSQYDRGTTAAAHENYCTRLHYPRRISQESGNNHGFAPMSRSCGFQYRN
ncbi:hypothetical protein PRK78_007359 [Emydomyces testavorans]|uniref:RRM domain-containing protein n=1 Tax=Emydomyces testavorans TaxID=2070801 RepID=A0AAF0DNK3_9EURO|nr:hypothetical protein PRK78_007359 [Emydomyces testavorans]